MRELGPFLTVCGLVCVWPALVFALGMWIGRNGIPIHVTWKPGGRREKGAMASSPGSSRYGDINLKG